jgi:hypothetical protein
MSIASSNPSTAIPPPSRDTAFVIHLAPPAGEPADAARGRVEHVMTGQVARFDSATELVDFMRDALASLQAGRLATNEAR